MESDSNVLESSLENDDFPEILSDIVQVDGEVTIPDEIGDIVQVDGNTTVPDEDEFTCVGLNSVQFPSIQQRRSLFEPPGQEVESDITMTDISAEVSEPTLASHSRDFRYKYSLNSHNQARRLVAGAQKPPLSFTYNNIKTVDGVQYAHNVNIDLNSGVYLSAIKPVLETLTTGWSTELDNWTGT